MQSVSVENGSGYDIEKEIKAFDEAKLGVKGLVETGIAKIPSFFEVPGADVACREPAPAHLQIPVIDLQGIHEDPVRRQQVIEEVLNASEKWGFFQIVNHGISLEIMDEMMEGVRKFHEQDDQQKLKYHSRDHEHKKVRYTSNPLLHKAKVGNWKDTLYCRMAPETPEIEEIPEICRDILLKYSVLIRGLGFTLFELLSEALGLNRNHLSEMDCGKANNILGHYYPACPEPNRTMGSSPHKDPDFLTILMQDQVGGLQVRYQNQYIDVPHVPGAFVVNIGDLLQLVSNNKFKSVEHRVLANNVGPRISVVCFFTTYKGNYGPLAELVSEENPAMYKEIPVTDYMAQYTKRVLTGKTTTEILEQFVLSNTDK